MKAFAFALLLATLVSSCCSILTMDLVEDSFEHSYRLNFRNAVDEGATAEQASHLAERAVTIRYYDLGSARLRRIREMNRELYREMGAPYP